MKPDEIYIREQLMVQQDQGALTVVHQSVPVLQGVSAEVHYRFGGESRLLSLRSAETMMHIRRDEVRLHRRNGDIHLEWRVRLGQDLEMVLDAQNVGAAPLRLDRLVPLCVSAPDGGALQLGAPPEGWRFYQHGWQSWSPTFARHVGDGIYLNPGGGIYHQMHLPHPDSGTEDFASEWFTVLYSRGEPPLAALLGFTDGRQALADIALWLEGRAFARLAATCYADGIVLEPGERFVSEPLLVSFGQDPLGLLERYADRVAARMQSRVPDRIPSGWCSWYYFYGENTADDVRANVAYARKARLPLDTILIDDGYQGAIGDWLRIDGGKFPDGMKAAADGIRAAGMRPGIWLAPFGVSSESETYAEHPDWVVRDADGAPAVAWQHWGEDIYALDVSNPDALDWVGHILRVMSDEWGYEFFKVDFVFAAAVAGFRHDPKTTRAAAYRRGMERIRKTIGDKFLLGCGAPQLPSVGIVDAMRIGPDVAFNWQPLWADLSMPACANALRNTQARYFMHRRWWLNDADCILVRTRHDQSNLVLNEMRSLVTFVALSGGLALDSDNLPAIRPGRLKYLKMALPPSGLAARPVDLFQHESPQYQVLEVEKPWGHWWVASLMNWRQKTKRTRVELRDLGLPEGEFHVYNFWRQRYLGIHSGALSFGRHQPHESIVLCLKPVSDQPDLLASTFHVTQGAAEVAEMRRVVHGPSGQTLRVALLKRGTQRGQLVFTVPKPWRVTGVRVDGRKHPFHRSRAGIVTVRLRLKEHALVEMDCIKGS